MSECTTSLTKYDEVRWWVCISCSYVVRGTTRCFLVAIVRDTAIALELEIASLLSIF